MKHFLDWETDYVSFNLNARNIGFNLESNVLFQHEVTITLSTTELFYMTIDNSLIGVDAVLFEVHLNDSVGIRPKNEIRICQNSFVEHTSLDSAEHRWN